MYFSDLYCIWSKTEKCFESKPTQKCYTGERNDYDEQALYRMLHDDLSGWKD